MKRRRHMDPLYRDQPPLRILLTNGRFPTSLDLARQLYIAGHTIFSVDTFAYPICKFSKAVKQSAQIPGPHDDADGYVRAVKELSTHWHIDIIIPCHEEVFVLANSEEPEIIDKLFSPPYEMLVRLQDRHEFSKLMEQLHLRVPKTYLCKSLEDVRQVPFEKFPNGIVLKPCLRRTSGRGSHLVISGDPLPTNIPVNDQNWYVAQELLAGDRFRSYSVVRNGQVEATGVYRDTGDSAIKYVYHQQFHPGIYDYIHDFVSTVPAFNGQIAFDFVETSDGIYAVECNPRATPGLHLWCNTLWLARALTGSLPREIIERPIRPPRRGLGHESHAQVPAGLLELEHEDPTFAVWAKHMRRLLFTRDVVWDWRDPMPTIAQPFLVTKYYSMCRKSGLRLSNFFRRDILWEPSDAELEDIRALCAEKGLQVRSLDEGMDLEGWAKV